MQPYSMAWQSAYNLYFNTPRVVFGGVTNLFLYYTWLPLSIGHHQFASLDDWYYFNFLILLRNSKLPKSINRYDGIFLLVYQQSALLIHKKITKICISIIFSSKFIKMLSYLWRFKTVHKILHNSFLLGFKKV